VLQSEIERRFHYHPPFGNQNFLYDTNRALFVRLAEHINSLGDSRESSLALTALQESLMWVNAHISCNGVDAEDDDA
jgi:hypothetical protein